MNKESEYEYLHLALFLSSLLIPIELIWLGIVAGLSGYKVAVPIFMFGGVVSILFLVMAQKRLSAELAVHYGMEVQPWLAEWVIEHEQTTLDMFVEEE